MSRANRSSRMLFLSLLVFLVAGCGTAQPQPTFTPVPPTVTPAPTAPTPTPTPTEALILRPDEQTPTPSGCSGGELEIRIPFSILGEGEAVSTDVPDCVTTISFRLLNDGSRTMIEGEGPIDCHFVDTPQGAPITFHVLVAFQGTLTGEVLPATPTRPSGWLDAFLNLDGTITQYYIGYPDEATNPCPESSPCRTSAADVMPLVMDWEDGSTVTTPWTFILHLR